MRILSLEDNADLQKALISVLEKDGHEILGVATIQRARSSLEQQSFDLLISDGNLGLETSLELLREIRDRTLYPDMRVIVLTANPDIAHEARKLKYPVLEKPCRMRVLREEIVRLAPPHS